MQVENPVKIEQVLVLATDKSTERTIRLAELEAASFAIRRLELIAPRKISDCLFVVVVIDWRRVYPAE